jgi:hypothetical protein
MNGSLEPILVGVTFTAVMTVFLVPAILAFKRRLRFRGWLVFILGMTVLSGAMPAGPSTRMGILVSWAVCLLWAVLGPIDTSPAKPDPALGP